MSGMNERWRSNTEKERPNNSAIRLTHCLSNWPSRIHTDWPQIDSEPLQWLAADCPIHGQVVLFRELLLLLLLLLLFSQYKFQVTADTSTPGCPVHSALRNYKLPALQVTLSTLLQSACKMQILGAFAKLWIATVSFIISVRPSIASQKIAQLQEMDFHEIFYWVFSLSYVQKVKVWLRRTNAASAAHKELRVMHVCNTVLPFTTNVQEIRF